MICSLDGSVDWKQAWQGRDLAVTYSHLRMDIALNISCTAYSSSIFISSVPGLFAPLVFDHSEQQW